MPLRLLCDEHVDQKAFYPQLCRTFSPRHVSKIPQLGSGTQDTEIWKHAVQINYNVLTADSHFVDGSADPGSGTHPGVIYYDDDAQINTLMQALRGIDDLLSSSQIASNDEEIYIPGTWPQQAP